MKSNTVGRAMLIAFVVGFFLYLFGPLIVMSITAFNSSSFPRVSPWDCFSVEWFNVLINDQRLMLGLRNSFLIGVGVILLAVPIGLAGALMLTQVDQRLRPWYYTIVISPILVPGVVLGISTLIFWDRLGSMFNAGYDSIFYDGIFLTIVGQSTFISAYAMLVFIARLQRFDPALEEAALDLGATHVQTFRKILLPFLKPAIGSAAVLAFLASFENYNTTVFTIVSESTLTTVLASKVRYGINPSISALAVIIVALTLFAAVIFEVLKRREQKAQAAAKATEAEPPGSTAPATRAAKANVFAEPALIMTVLVFVAGIGTVYFSGTIGVSECKVRVAAEKRRLVDQRVKELRTKQMFESGRPGATAGAATVTGERIEARGTEGYKGIFDPGNLSGQADSSAPEPERENTAAPDTGGYQNVFDPENLQDQVDSSEKTQ
ncbi:MAG: ABC transporter permease [Gammaproteobacteria bacterium]